uniref:Uncharacterized protein n=1 Tax=Oryza sativa subsp. japonica TaxID=39947 RepID=Q6ZCR0_ORYSJ|nr:hypothetical protein [Oryza sativa Japonica Group]
MEAAAVADEAEAAALKEAAAAEKDVRRWRREVGALLGGDLRPDLLPEKEEEEDSSELSLAGASSTSIHVSGGCSGCCATRPLRAREAPAAADPPLPRLAAMETDADTASGEGGGSRCGERRPAAAETEAGAQQRRRQRPAVSSAVAPRVWWRLI